MVVGIAAGWLTWFVNLDRTMFIFYIAPAVPFLVLAVTLVLQDVLGPAAASPLRAPYQGPGAAHAPRRRRA